MVLAEAKPNIFVNMPKYQLACRPGHRATEHLFVLKSVMAKYIEEKKSILVASFDISKMFDKVDAHFCLEKAYSSNVRGKIYRMLYQMNKNIKVKVKTPVGVTPLKFFPANLNIDPHDHIRLIIRFVLLLSSLTPVPFKGHTCQHTRFT